MAGSFFLGALGEFFFFAEGYPFLGFWGGPLLFFPVLTDCKGHYLQSQERDWEGMEDGGGCADKGDPDWRNMTWDLS